MKPFVEGDFLKAGHLDPLTLLDGANKLGGFDQAFVGAGVEPGIAPGKLLHIELAHFHIGAVEIGDLVFAPGGRLDLLGQLHDAVVVEIEPCHGLPGPGRLGFSSRLMARPSLSSSTTP